MQPFFTQTAESDVLRESEDPFCSQSLRRLLKVMFCAKVKIHSAAILYVLS